MSIKLGKHEHMQGAKSSLQLLPRRGLRLAAQSRCRSLSRCSLLLDVRSPQGGADGVGEAEEDAYHGDKLEQDSGDAEAATR
jgi:hypothetical protein